MGQMVVSRSRELTQRDLAIVEWIGRVGAATIEQVARQFGLGRTKAYGRVGACVEMGLLTRHRILYEGPALLTATRAGLLATGLPLKVVRVSPALARHHAACGWVAVHLSERASSDAVLSDRELRLEEHLAGKPIASAKVGELPNGSPRLHRPDFAILGEEVEAFEVELTAKAPRRLDSLVRAWRRARYVSRVTYLCGGAQTRAAVERAVARTCSEDRVFVASLSEVVR